MGKKYKKTIKNPALHFSIKRLGGVSALVALLYERSGVRVTKMAVYKWLWTGSVPKILLSAVSRITGESEKALGGKL